jgi:predicted transcriptional regulator
MSTTIRISQASWKSLKELADSAGESMQTILDKAIETYRRQWFLERANKAFAVLKANPDEWNDEIKERTQWDTLQDGLESDE